MSQQSLRRTSGRHYDVQETGTSRRGFRIALPPKRATTCATSPSTRATAGRRAPRGRDDVTSKSSGASRLRGLATTLSPTAKFSTSHSKRFTTAAFKKEHG
jgi:hypothetical protein